MKRLLFTLAFTLVFAIFADDPQSLPKAFFRYAGRDFSLQEAQLIAPGKTDPQSLRAALESNLPAVAAMVLCSRSGIELSQEHTRLTLLDSLQMMSDARQREFEAMLANNSLTIDSWLDQESMKFELQLNDALRRWFKKVNIDRRIGEQAVRDHYYRNLHIFRRTRLDEDKVLVFDAGNKDACNKALAALLQGSPVKFVKEKYAQKILSGEWIDDLQNCYPRRSSVGNGFFTVQGAQHLYLVKSDALQEFYIKLDDKLFRAISNTLYDALAKAYLAELLKKNFSGCKLEFY